MIWSEYIRSLGPEAAFIMLTLAALFAAMFIGVLEFHRPDRR